MEKSERRGACTCNLLLPCAYLQLFPSLDSNLGLVFDTHAGFWDKEFGKAALLDTLEGRFMVF